MACATLHAFLVAHSNGYNGSGGNEVRMSPHAVHFLASIVEYWGGDLARMQSLMVYNDSSVNNEYGAGVHGVLEFVRIVREILIMSFVIAAKLKQAGSIENGNDLNVNEFRVSLNLIQQQIKLAYCRMGRCVWGMNGNDGAGNDLSSFDFVNDLIGLAAANGNMNAGNNVDAPSHQACGCAVLSTFCEEISRDDLMLTSPMPSMRMTQLRSMLNGALSQIIACVAYVIAQSSSQCQLLHTNASIVRDCLRCITSVLCFAKCLHLKGVNVSSAISVDLVRSLFLVINLAAQADGQSDVGSEVIEAGAYAFDCISEVIQMACWPAGEAENFVIEVSSHALKSLAIECSNIEASRYGEDEPICVENFRSQASHFLEVFCTNQLTRASRLPSSTFDMSTFLQLMARYTFALPSALEQTDCLVSWIRLAEFFEECAMELPSQSFVLTHGEGLAEVLSAVFRLNLFATNLEKLKDLDGEELDFPDESAVVDGNDADNNFESSRDYSKSNNQNISSSESRQILSPHVDAALRSTERGCLLAESCTLSALLCPISSHAAISAYETVTVQLKTLLTQLESLVVNNTSSPKNENICTEVDRLSWDICVCYRFLDSGLVSITAVSHRRKTSKGESALHEFWELCNIIVSTSENLLSHRVWSKFSSLAYIISTCCSCLSTLHRGLCALAVEDDIVRSPAEIFTTKLLEHCLSAFDSFSTLPAPSFVISAICSLFKTCSDSLSTSLLGPKYLIEGHNSFSLKCRESSITANKRRSTLSQKQLQLVFQSSIKLIFSLGYVTNVRVLSSNLKALFEEQGSIFVELVFQPICQELVSRCQELKVASGDGTRMRILMKCGITVQRNSQALSSLCVEIDAMNDVAKQVLANAFGQYTEQILFLTGIYTSCCMQGGPIIVSTFTT